jgi:3-oxoacyl-[acyl-carrier protein] reductase
MLKDRVAVVTGASRGIGKAVALKLAREGARVAVIYCGNKEAADNTVTEAESYGAKAICYRCDVSSLDECGSVVSQITKDLGTIDILVNNAGITRDNLMLLMKEDDFDSVVSTNLKGTFNMIKSCYSQFMKKRYGKIINITSVSGIMGNAGQTNYSASKAGVIGLTKSVAKELAGRNVCCNAIAPGFIDTDMTEKFKEQEQVINAIPLKRIGSPEDVANLAAFLADDCSDYITGEVIRIDGGLAM